MTSLHDDPADFAATALRGFCDVFASGIRPIRGGAIRADGVRDNKVAFVVGGGSGHYPAFLGYIGEGLADAAVAGDVFASPSARAIRHAARVADRGAGVLLGYGNYAGDVLNFGLAAALLRADGIEARLIAVTDDIASAPAAEARRRRGIAGDLAVFKIAGAAAASGLSLDAVEAVARSANAATRSLGVALSGCTLPGATSPLFSVADGRIAIGLGIHGEPGIEECDMMPAATLARMLTDALLREAPAQAGMRIAAILNGLGSTKSEALFVLWAAISEQLRARGYTIVAPAVGEFVTSLDMAGCSLTLTWLDADLERYWLAACDAPVFHRAVGHRASNNAASSAPFETDPEDETPVHPAGTATARATGRFIAGAIERIAALMREQEAELGRLDAVAGDGDHGQGMARGSAAASLAAAHAAESSAAPARVLTDAGDAWAARAGGTSGALWGVGLVAAGAMLGDDGLGDDRGTTMQDVAAAAEAALAAIVRLGGAAPGDKTLVDALQPFVAALSEAARNGADVGTAWHDAAAIALAAARDTASLTPRLGRARPLAERSIGHADPGAMSLAHCIAAAGMPTR